MKLAVLFLCLVAAIRGTLSAKILGVCPTPSIGHQKPFLIIMRALAERGHQVTVITTDPIEDPPQNLTQIDVSFSYARWRKELSFMKMSRLPLLSFLPVVWPTVARICDDQLSSEQIKQLLQSNETFDAIVLENFFFLCHFGLQDRLGNPPVIGFSSMTVYPYFYDIMGNPNNPSYSPDFGTSNSDHMTFWERMNNVYQTLGSRYLFHNTLVPLHEEIRRKHFGADAPSIYEAQYNQSLLIVNNHFSLNYPRPLLPNIIQVTGLHINKTRNPLPKDLKDFLDGATDGFIYFSLGSNMNSTNLPEEKRLAFLEAFSELPQRVLWKWEADSLPGKPDNVMIIKWTPQQDLLAHPNIRLFITHGGLQSMNEAAYNAVPLLGMPFFSDQRINTRKMKAAGIGERILLADVTKETVKTLAEKIIRDPSYRENMRRFSAVFREHQAESLDKSVWWIEYVIRHSGAPHLRTAALDLHWWQYLLLDVLCFVLAVSAGCLFITYRIVLFAVHSINRRRKVKSQ